MGRRGNGRRGKWEEGEMGGGGNGGRGKWREGEMGEGKWEEGEMGERGKWEEGEMSEGKRGKWGEVEIHCSAFYGTVSSPLTWCSVSRTSGAEVIGFAFLSACTRKTLLHCDLQVMFTHCNTKAEECLCQAVIPFT
jgi:hypothetical protein